MEGFAYIRLLPDQPHLNRDTCLDRQTGADMTRDDEPDGEEETQSENEDWPPESEDCTLAFLPPHTRMHYEDADARMQNALAHVNPERAEEFLRAMHGVQAGQEALLRALTAERLLHRVTARYWLDVYERIVG